MGLFDLPVGEVVFFVDGKWKSYMFTDTFDLEDINACNAMHWRLPSETKGKFIMNGVVRIFELR